MSDAQNDEDQVETSNGVTIYKDIWRMIADKLDDPQDLLELGSVDMRSFELIQEPRYEHLICYPFKSTYKLTREQYSSIDELKKSENRYKVILGNVGSGKTFVSTAYVLRKYEEQLLHNEVKILFIVPPANVAQWSNFLQKRTNLSVLSNYKSSCFYKKKWFENLGLYNIYISSENLAHRISSIINMDWSGTTTGDEGNLVIVHDECHRKTTISAHMGCLLEYIGLTASQKTWDNSPWTWQIEASTFQLHSGEIRANLRPLVHVDYELTGYDKVIKTQIVDNFIFKKGKKLMLTQIYEIQTLLTFGRLLGNKIRTKVGRKIITVGNPTKNDTVCPIEDFLAAARTIPKLVALVSLAKQIKAKGEKLIIFDRNTDYINIVYLLLHHEGLDTYIFSQTYDVQGRVRQLEKFKERGDVLIGSVSMLSEGHNITEANHITFLRWPVKEERYVQAIGRCHRHPQDKEVYLHFIFACELERQLAFQGMMTGFKYVLYNDLHHLLIEFDK